MNAAKLPLAGVKVLDFSWALVGALTTKQLGDFGATIVKVESAGRMCLTRMDAQVKISTPRNPNDKPWFAHLNTSKQGMLLDLKRTESRAVLNRLIAWADVVVENFSPGTMQKLGLDYAELKKQRPDIVMVSGSVYGQTGPMSQEWGIDGTGAALSSRIFMTGWPDREPVLPSVPYGDALLPLLMAGAAVAALDRRSRTGEGAHIDASMFEAQIQQMLPAVIEQQLTHLPPERTGNRIAEMSPHGVFPCAGEDRWIAIACEDDGQWQSFARLVGCDEPRFATLAQRKQFENEVETAVADWTLSRDAYELMAQLQSIGIPAGVLQNAGDVLERDPQLTARGFLQDVTHPVLGVFGHQAPPYKLSKTPAVIRSAPLLGEHTRHICLELLGIPAEEFERLDGIGVFA